MNVAFRGKETTMGSQLVQRRGEAVKGGADAAGANDRALVRAALDRDDRAWQEIVCRFEPAMCEVVRDATAQICPLTDAEVDDLLGDFWLRLIADDMRWLRAFDPSRGATLRTWLTFQVAHVAQEHVRALRRERGRLVPLDDAAQELDRQSAAAFACPIEGVSLSPDEERQLARVLGRFLARLALAEPGIGAA